MKEEIKNALAGKGFESNGDKEMREEEEKREARKEGCAQEAIRSLKVHLKGSINESRGEIEHHAEGKTEGIKELIKSPLSIKDLENFMLGWDKVPEDIQKLILVVYPEVATAVLRKKLADYSGKNTLPPYRDIVEKL